MHSSVRFALHSDKVSRSMSLPVLFPITYAQADGNRLPNNIRLLEIL